MGENAKHWFTTRVSPSFKEWRVTKSGRVSVEEGQCRKAVLGVWGGCCGRLLGDGCFTIVWDGPRKESHLFVPRLSVSVVASRNVSRSG